MQQEWVHADTENRRKETCQAVQVPVEDHLLCAPAGRVVECDLLCVANQALHAQAQAVLTHVAAKILEKDLEPCAMCSRQHVQPAPHSTPVTAGFAEWVDKAYTLWNVSRRIPQATHAPAPSLPDLPCLYTRLIQHI